MMKRVFVVVIMILLLGGCGKPQVQIDWVDFVQFNGIQYLRTNNTVEEGMLGPQVGSVKFKVAGNVYDAKYQLKDGDAAFFQEGTPIYSVNGYKPNFRIAAGPSKTPYIYQVFSNPKAKLGSDVADISNKVNYISINEKTNDQEIATIRDEQKVQTMVDMFLNAPVTQTRTTRSSNGYFISFHLKDGSEYKGPFWIESGEFSQGIILPETFRKLVEESLYAQK